ncbi:hypothetical protein K439DRAFT_1634124, partial [Ramaria rubella]
MPTPDEEYPLWLWDAQEKMRRSSGGSVLTITHPARQCVQGLGNDTAVDADCRLPSHAELVRRACASCLVPFPLLKVEHQKVLKLAPNTLTSTAISRVRVTSLTESVDRKH